MASFASKKAKRTYKDTRPSKSYNKTNHSNDDQFKASSHHSLTSSLLRTNSTRTQGRPLAEAHFNAKKTQHFHSQICRVGADAARLLVDSADTLLTATINFREAFIIDNDRLSIELKKDHGRLLSTNQQTAAETGRATWVAFRSDERAKTSSSSTAEPLPPLVPVPLFPDTLQRLLPHRPRESNRPRRGRDSRHARMKRRLEIEEHNELEEQTEEIIQLMDQMDVLSKKVAPKTLPGVPQDLLEKMIVLISTKTEKGSNDRGTARSNCMTLATRLGYGSPADVSFRRYVTKYEVDGSFPKKNGRPPFMPPGVLATVLTQIGDLTQKEYSPHLDKVIGLMDKSRARHANSQGNGDQVPSKKTESRQLNALRTNTITTRKADSVTGTKKRWEGGCWRSAITNLSLYYSLACGPRHGLSREFSHSNSLGRGRLWNTDAFGMTFYGGHSSRLETFALFQDRNDHIRGETGVTGNNLPLRVDPFVLMNSAGQAFMCIPVKLTAKDTLFDEARDIYDIKLTEDKIHLVFYKGKGNAANGLSTKVNLCLHLIDAFILPTILDELRHNGWNGEMIDLNPKEWSSALTIDGEGCMAAAVKIRTLDGTFAKYRLRVGKTSPKTTGKHSIGQPCDRVRSGFKSMHKMSNTFFSKIDEEKRFKRSVEVAKKQGEPVPLRKEPLLFNDIENLPLMQELKKAVCGGTAATLNFNFVKWRELGMLLLAIRHSFASSFRYFDVMEAFNTWTNIHDFRTTVVAALQHVDGYNYDLDDTERELIVDEDTIEAYKLLMCDHPGLNDNMLNELKLPKGRDPRNKSDFGDSQQYGFEYTHKKYIEKDATDKIAEIAAQKIKDDTKAAKLAKREKIAAEKKRRFEEKAAREATKEVERVKALDASREKGRNLFTTIINGSFQFTTKERNSLKHTQYKDLAVWLGFSSDIYKAKTKIQTKLPVVKMLKILDEQGEQTMWVQNEDSDSDSDTSDEESDEEEEEDVDVDDDGDVTMASSSSSSSSSSSTAVATSSSSSSSSSSVVATTPAVAAAAASSSSSTSLTVLRLGFREGYVAGQRYRKHSLIRFDGSLTYWRALVNDPGQEWSLNWQGCPDEWVPKEDIVYLNDEEEEEEEEENENENENESKKKKRKVTINSESSNGSDSD